MRRRTMIQIAAASALSGTTVRAQGTKIHQKDGKLEIEIGGVPFTTYYFGPDFKKTFFLPLRDARGVAISRGYPVEAATGETADHPHHKGLWFAHGEVNGLDFWAEKAPIVHKAFTRVQSTGTGAAFEEKLEWLGADTKPLLLETRKVTMSGSATTRTLDFEATLTSAGGPVHFGDTKEGFFAVRVATVMAGNKGGVIEDSEGRRTEKEAWGHRSAWVDYSGLVNGEKVGVAIMDSPKQFRGPSYHHVRDYGLHAVNVFFGKKANKAVEEPGDYHLEPGKSITLRYRVFIHKGDAKEGKVAEAYAQYR